MNQTGLYIFFYTDPNKLEEKFQYLNLELCMPIVEPNYKLSCEMIYYDIDKYIYMCCYTSTFGVQLLKVQCTISEKVVFEK